MQKTTDTNLPDTTETAEPHTDLASGRQADMHREQARIPVAEERLSVAKDVVERLAGHVRLRTRETDVPVSETLKTGIAEIERVPVNRIVPEPPQPRTEGNVKIIPVVEEVLVRQYRIREEVRITSRVETSEWTGTVPLRRQEVEVDTIDDNDPPDGPTR